jgi:hypothetical protein
LSKEGNEKEAAFMKDDYLWDGSGEPDPKIQKLEALLAKYRHNRAAPDFEKLVPQVTELRPGVPRRYLWINVAAIAAGVMLLAVIWFSFRRPAQQIPQPGWDVARLEGAPRVGSKAIGQDNAGGRMLVGQALETDSSSSASIAIADIGEVQVDPGTRVRLIETGTAQKRLALDHGTIHAAIWAPPGEFVVDTPSAIAVDLGCAYTLQVDDSGAGLLRTTLGWVGFKLDNHDAFIPAGALCALRPKIGPGTPYYEDASEPLRTALYKLDFESLSTEQRDGELFIVLAQSRSRDALTLWHLLARVNDAERPRVYDRLAVLLPPPPHVTRAGILSLDQEMLDLWWNELGLGDASLWRTWERSWSQREKSKN